MKNISQGVYFLMLLRYELTSKLIAKYGVL